MKRRSREGRGRKKKLLVDTNILLLYIVGSLSLDRIARHKRTDTFTAEDYHLLAGLLRRFGGIVLTPNVLTEVSNLLGQTDERTGAALLAVLGTLVRDSEERYVESVEAVGTLEFLRRGLTDASILALPMEELAVLTDDVHLYLALQAKGVEVINFNHLREGVWG
jgi:predicted nucleic acid-binding protein